MSPEAKPRIINPGRTQSLFDGGLSGAGTKVIDFTVHADTLLLSLFVRSVTAGTITVTASTLHYPGEAIEVIEFPVISGPTTSIVLKKAAVVVANCQLRIAYTGDCDLQVVAKGLSVGDLSVSVVGAADLRTRKTPVGTSNVLLVPSALEDRAGIVIKNWSSSAIVYFAESSAQLTADQGFPLAPGEPFAMDIAAGQEIWAVASAADTDVRIIEAAT